MRAFTKEELLSAARAIEKIAIREHCSVEEVRKQIKVAMLNGLCGDDPKTKALWISIPISGESSLSRCRRSVLICG